jgi:hypothetical protein
MGPSFAEGRDRCGRAPAFSGVLQHHRRAFALLALLNLVTKLLALVQAGTLDLGDMDVDVLGAVIGLDEAVALCGVEPRRRT